MNSTVDVLYKVTNADGDVVGPAFRQTTVTLGWNGTTTDDLESIVSAKVGSLPSGFTVTIIGARTVTTEDGRFTGSAALNARADREALRSIRPVPAWTSWNPDGFATDEEAG